MTKKTPKVIIFFEKNRIFFFLSPTAYCQPNRRFSDIVLTDAKADVRVDDKASASVKDKLSRFAQLGEHDEQKASKSVKLTDDSADVRVGAWRCRVVQRASSGRQRTQHTAAWPSVPHTPALTARAHRRSGQRLAEGQIVDVHVDVVGAQRAQGGQEKSGNASKLTIM